MPEPTPQPPDAECNGESSDGTLCGLSANWGREKPLTENPGRCRYHKDQPIDADADTEPQSVVGYGGYWIGEDA